MISERNKIKNIMERGDFPTIRLKIKPLDFLNFTSGVRNSIDYKKNKSLSYLNRKISLNFNVYLAFNCLFFLK